MVGATLTAGLGAALIAIFTVSFQAIKATIANPKVAANGVDTTYPDS